MMQVSDAVFNSIHRKSRKFKALAEFKGFSLSDISFSLRSRSMLESGLTLGSVIVASGKMKTKKIDSIEKGAEFTLYVDVGVRDENGDVNYERLRLGKYTVIDSSKKSKELEISFEGELTKVTRKFEEELQYPVSVSQVLGAIENVCGVTINKTGINSDEIIEKDLRGMSCRDILKTIAQLNGKFVAVDNVTDEIVFKWYEESDYIINESNYLYMLKEPKFKEEFTANVFSCEIGEDIIYVGEGEGAISISNDFMTPEKVDEIYEQIIVNSFHSYTATELQFQLGNPLFDVWDVITVERNGTVAKVPVMDYELIFDGGLSANVNAYASTEDTEFEGVLTEDVAEAKMKIVALAGEVSSKVSKGEMETAIEQLANSIRISVEAVTNDLKSKQDDALKRITTIEQNSENIKIAIKSEIQQEGVKKVVTESGYEFGENGLDISRSDEALKSRLSNSGLTVKRNDTEILVANDKGVTAENVTVKKYLSVGNRSRFEDYASGTGCFWVGGK